MSATAVTERRVVVPFEASERIKEQMRAYRREGAKLAAMILYAEPERAAEEAVWDFLNKVQYVKRPTVADWLRQANVNPSLAVGEIDPERRKRLAGILYRYSQGQNAEAAA